VERCAARILRYAAWAISPQRVMKMDALPRTESGKILRTELARAASKYGDKLQSARKRDGFARGPLLPVSHRWNATMIVAPASVYQSSGKLGKGQRFDQAAN
jgi:hypothetical protein